MLGGEGPAVVRAVTEVRGGTGRKSGFLYRVDTRGVCIGGVFVNFGDAAHEDPSPPW